MSYKSRGCWAVGMCFKNCKHKNTEKCNECFRFSEFKEIKNGETLHGEDKSGD